MIDDPLGLGILALAALIVAIVALAKLTQFNVTVEELKRRLGKLEGVGQAPIQEPAPQTAAVPPPLPAYATQPKVTAPSSPPPATAPAKPLPIFNWESILGVKLFAWIGGFAFFLGVVFFVKYAFENNWITPAMRIIAGAITGTLLIIVSLLPKVRRYRIPAQSVCATGVLILYADVYAAHAFYDLIPLTAATMLMWIVTAVALLLATCLAAEPVVWLALVGGFVTPFLFRSGYANLILFATYIGVLDCAFGSIAVLKRWTYFLVPVAFLSVLSISAWVAGLFVIAPEPFKPGHSQFLFLVVEALFLGICTANTSRGQLNNWAIAAMAIAGWGALLGLSRGPGLGFYGHDWLPLILLADGGLIAFGTIHRRYGDKTRAMAMIVILALAFTALAECMWYITVRHALDPRWIVESNAAHEDAQHLGLLILRHVAIFLLFASTPYLVGTKRFWPWIVAAVAGPLQFFFVHEYIRIEGDSFGPVTRLVPENWLWLPTLAFALPAAVGIWYLVKKEHVELASGDSRLATQGAAVLAFVSLVFPVQFHHEWITLGWAIEGFLLILLFRWIPNRRLRAVGLIVLAGAFVRLTLNPAVLSYHPRTHVAIWNWYLYAYGIAAICFFISAQWFGAPKEKPYEKFATPLLYSLAGIVLFLLMNIEIADYFSIGPTLTFSFTGNFARDMSYTIAWSVFAFCLLVLGIARNVRVIRLVAIGLLLVTFAKLFLHDLDSLKQLYRIGAFIAVAIVAIVASFVYQRFLLPQAKT